MALRERRGGALPGWMKRDPGVLRAAFRLALMSQGQVKGALWLYSGDKRESGWNWVEIKLFCGSEAGRGLPRLGMLLAPTLWSLLGQSWERGDLLRPPKRQTKLLAGAVWLFWRMREAGWRVRKDLCKVYRNSFCRLHLHTFIRKSSKETFKKLSPSTD